MQHEFSHLVISISGVCTRCDQYIRNGKAVSQREMEEFRANPQALREFKLKLAYDELDRHECKP